MAASLVRSSRAILVISLLVCARAYAADCNIVCQAPAFTSCTCVDANPADACIITTIQDDAAPGAVIDCTGVDIVVKNRVTVANGFMTLRADDLTVHTNRIEATRTQNGVAFGMILELSGTLDVIGLLEASSNTGGGTIEVLALGDIVIRDDGTGIVAKGTSANSDGGQVFLASGRDIQLLGDIDLDGSAQGYTRGGRLSVDAERDVIVRTQISAAGRNVEGGDVDLVARTGSLDVQSCGSCYLKVEGAGPDGDGGSIFVSADEVVLSAPISAQGGVGTGGGESAGGSLSVRAGNGGLALAGDVDVTSGAGGSGSIDATSAGDLSVANGVDLITKCDANGGDGGDVRLSAGGQLSIGDALIDARGDWGGLYEEGFGAAIDLEGCTVAIGSGAVIDARGFDGGDVTVTARGALTVSATSTIDASSAGGNEGSIMLEYRTDGRCSGGMLAGCEPDHCTVGGTCADASTVSCTVDGDCDPCAAGQCVPNPDTGGTTSQFHPRAPELHKDASLTPCN